MNRLGIGRRWLACAALLGGGCGAIPDIIVDAARSSAKEALQEAVGDAVGGIVDDTVAELLGFDEFEFPFVEQIADEEDGDALLEDGENVEGSEQDTR